MSFTRTFHDQEIGQICVMRSENDDGLPECRIYFEPPELGVCSMAYGFDADEEGFDKRDQFFENLSSKQVVDCILAIPGIWD